MEPVITKIKLGKSDRPELHFERWHNGASEISKVVGDAADDALTSKMQALLDTLCGVCCLGEAWDDGRITGLSLKSTDDGTGVVITGQLRVDDDGSAYVVVANSPYLSPDKQGQREQMSIKGITAAARDYLDSLPQQQSLL